MTHALLREARRIVTCVPIAVALGLVAMTAIVLMQGVDMLPNVALVMFEGSTNFPLLAIPLFILAG
ncbi:MAG: TRAP transporter large permease subunit, partial [Gammaproteobacteria bacterium]